MPQTVATTNSKEKRKMLWSEDSNSTLGRAFRDEQDLDTSRVDERSPLFFFCKGLESKYFVLCGSLVVSVVALQLFHFVTKAAERNRQNEWTELCSIKTERDSRPGFECSL